ncbi:QacE family quaternary ammonium compound efflux SMR transporter [Jannaschia sp. Os4]|uniref:SMR family transporter n=1 Tax=Jannaschia sp. Os4 TaxID=2807617 RepID=UPI0019395D61|nr:SMR family transporter [Jannaschia sp. Os4]MBM2576635.1 QacE family quaternary ammonium compound efflux SMR transporter [Jannaschia sp. Os4]
MPWLLLVLAIAAETVGTTALKASEGFTRAAPSVVTVIAYAVSFYLLAQVLRTIPVGIAYAIWSGLGIVLITAIGWLVFRQSLDAPALIGMALIVAGILVMQLFSNSTGH